MAEHNTAVLALHYQNEVLHENGRIRVGVDDPGVRARVMDAAARLLASARRQGLAIFHVRIAFRPDYADCPSNTPIFRQTMQLGAVREGSWGADFVDGLQPAMADAELGSAVGSKAAPEFVLTHQRISAFSGTALDNLLRMRGVQHLIVGGVATHSVVEHTVRQAVDLGYVVRIAQDACASGQPELHQAALRSLALVAQIVQVQDCFAG